MTLIASFSFHNVPILIGDILLSSEMENKEEVYVPTISGCLGEEMKCVSGLRQKIQIVGDKIAIACAGNAALSKQLINLIMSKNEERELSSDELIKYIDDIYARNQQYRDDVAVLGYYQESALSYRSFSKGCKTYSSLVFGNIMLSGTGSSCFEEMLRSLENNPLVLPKETNALTSGLVNVFELISQLILAEISGNYDSIISGFGAGYEIVMPINGKLSKLDDFLLLFWEAKIDEEKLFLFNLPYKGFKYQYKNEMLVIRASEFKASKERGVSSYVKETNDKVFFISPTQKKVTANVGLELPELSSKIICNFFILELPNGELKILMILNFSENRDGQIKFVKEERGVQLQIDMNFLDVVREQIVTKYKL